jgi:uncharacterized OsmC-like protein
MQRLVVSFVAACRASGLVSQPPHTILNGLDTTALGGLVETLQANPRSGQVTFSSHSRWQDGARVLSRMAGYRIDGQRVHDDERRFVLLCDEPTELSGTDAAPAPAEQLMHALASCIAATTNANVAFMGVRLDRLDAMLEGDIDLHGIFGLDEKVRPGFSAIRAKVDIAGDADAATLREIAGRGLRSSPIRDSVENGVDIDATRSGGRHGFFDVSCGFDLIQHAAHGGAGQVNKQGKAVRTSQFTYSL